MFVCLFPGLKTPNQWFFSNMLILSKKISLFWLCFILGTVFFILGFFHYLLAVKTSLLGYLSYPKTQNYFQILNSEYTEQSNPFLIEIIQKWIDNPSTLAYNLSEPNRRDFSLGQSPLVDRIFKQKVSNIFQNNSPFFIFFFF